MQADGRLVKYIEDSDQTRTDLRGETDALRLSSGERARRTAEREVSKTDVLEEPEPRLYLLDDHAAYLLFPVRELRIEVLKEVKSLHHRKVGEFHYVFAAYRNSQDRVFQLAPLADRAHVLSHHVADLLFYEVGVCLAPSAFEARNDALESVVHMRDSAAAALVSVLEPARAGAVEKLILEFRRKRLERHVKTCAVVYGQAVEHLPVEAHRIER